jgi:hypothetical protein
MSAASSRKPGVTTGGGEAFAGDTAKLPIAAIRLAARMRAPRVVGPRAS